MGGRLPVGSTVVETSDFLVVSVIGLVIVGSVVVVVGSVVVVVG